MATLARPEFPVTHHGPRTSMASGMTRLGLTLPVGRSWQWPYEFSAVDFAVRAVVPLRDAVGVWRTGGFVGRIENETRIAFWPDEPADHGFDPSLLITVDLARTPTAAALGEISFDAVEVDDCFSGPNGNVGGTTIGPRWPEIQLTGAVYLEQRFCRRLPEAVRPVFPPKFMGGRAHEYMTAVYWPDIDDPRAGKRYAGHHAEVLEERNHTADVHGRRPSEAPSECRGMR